MGLFCEKCGQRLKEWERRKGHRRCVRCYYGETFKAEDTRIRRGIKRFGDKSKSLPVGKKKVTTTPYGFVEEYEPVTHCLKCGKRLSKFQIKNNYTYCRHCWEIIKRKKK